MRKFLRTYFMIQTVCLCLTLLAAGTVIAKQRTDYMASGVQAAVQTDTPVRQTVAAFAQRFPRSQWTDKLCLLPYPVGNIIAIISLIKNIVSS